MSGHLFEMSVIFTSGYFNKNICDSHFISVSISKRLPACVCT